jgi:hypothetical protein
MAVKTQSLHLPVDHWEIILKSAQAKIETIEDPAEDMYIQVKRIHDIISSHADSINALLLDRDRYKGQMPRHPISFPIDLVKSVYDLQHE